MDNIQSLAGLYRTFARVDREAIVHNGQLAKRLFSGQQLLCVLKADAYGHGISGVLPAYETFADQYAVATYEEALAVRQQSQKPILLFGAVPFERMIPGMQRDLTFTLGSVPYARELSRRACQAGLTAKCHIKVDTGLNRSGIRWREGNQALEQLQTLYGLPGLEITGVYTHLACPEGEEPWEQEYTQLQLSRFREALEAMQDRGLSPGLRHCLATGGALVHPEARMDMVRLGMLPMGMCYNDEVADRLGLRPALTWISFLTQVETLSQAEAVSYGCTFRAPGDMVIGIVSCGYADGYRRCYSNRAHMLVGGREAPVIGRIAMDCAVVDLTGVPDPKPGMPVILLGSDGCHRVSAQMLSRFGESVSGEVTAAISSRVPRFYDDPENNAAKPAK